MPAHKKSNTHKKLSHSNFREKVCIFCFQKSKNILSQTWKNKISAFNAPFDFNDPRTPSGLCKSCGIKFGKAFSIQDFLYLSFDFITLPDNFEISCDCEICLIAKSPPTTSKKFCGAKAKPQLKIRNDGDKKSPVKKHCSLCWSWVPEWKFKDHHCSEQILVDNCVQVLTRSKSPNSSTSVLTSAGEKVASSLLKNAEKSPGGTTKLSQPKGGAKLPVTLIPSKQSSPKKVSANKILKISKKLNLGKR